MDIVLYVSLTVEGQNDATYASVAMIQIVADTWKVGR